MKGPGSEKLPHFYNDELKDKEQEEADDDFVGFFEMDAVELSFFAVAPNEHDDKSDSENNDKGDPARRKHAANIGLKITKLFAAF